MHNMSIHLRAKTLAKIRNFFAMRSVTEVETPLLSHATNPSPYLNSFCCDGLYLQTSPEFAMKRLLAAGSGDIYQICKAFRRDELGRLHNPEFTMLEWYRIGFTHHDLMHEVGDLLKLVLNVNKTESFSYEQIFTEILHLNPYTSSINELKIVAKLNNLEIHDLTECLNQDYDTWLQILFTHLIEPKIGLEFPVFIYDFPESQAMLARVRDENPRVASRFEVYFQGVELTNGFHELNDTVIQRARFLQDLEARKNLNLPPVPLDENFLAALPELPDCSGVAIGVDRLLLLTAKCNSLDDVLCYSFIGS